MTEHFQDGVTAPSYLQTGVFSPGGIEFFPHQLEGAEFLQRGSMALWDEMGTGKTNTALKADEDSVAQTTLILHPHIARGMWIESLTEYYGERPDINVIEKSSDRLHYSRFTLVSSSLLQRAHDALMEEQWDRIIVDESHQYKSPSAKRTRALYGTRAFHRGVGSRADAIWPLTGTPMPNGPHELWTVLKALAPHLITNEMGRTMSYAEFIIRYCDTRQTPFGTKIIGGRDLPQLHERIKPFFMRRLLKDVFPDLPKPLVSQLPIDLTVSEKSSLARSIKELHLAPDYEDWPLEALPTVQALTGALKVEHTAAYVEDLLENGADNVVVFFVNRMMGEGLKARLEKYGVSLIYGDTKDRDGEINKFKSGKNKVAALNITIASTAINLQMCRYVVFGQLSWTAMDNVQALRRCSRYGQKSVVIVRVIHMSGTIDENVSRAITDKVVMILGTLQEEDDHTIPGTTPNNALL